jgi:peptidoglycan/LPS O-acetylase OafA/YrhL
MSVATTGKAASPNSRFPTYLPSLDGWRAVSILLVLGFHCKAVPGFPESFRQPFKWIFDGPLGVRIFFLISGFLITFLLLREHRLRGRANLRNFYLRRSFRIFPVYFCFLGVLLLLQIFTPYEQELRHWIANLTFTTNFTDAPWTSGHLWSLAIEEQFYLLWPAFFCLAGVAIKPSKAVWILLPAILFPPVARVIDYLHLAPPEIAHLFSWSSFLYNCDSLAIGCATGILFFSKIEWLEEVYKRFPVPLFVLGLAFFLVPYLSSRVFILGMFTVPLGYSFEILGIAILLVQSILHPRAFFYSVLNYGWVRWIGVLSYSIYIWQQIFCSGPEVFGLGTVWWMSFPGWIVPALIVAVISYYGLERPVMRLRERFR